ncbi:chaperone NapD [Ferrimonas sediminicola]|uniref:chaperone NapD n=1 Tax=Ferrimonas sediminicola TaxID=2569538 RepID=UPI00145F582B|nr:chaperone NapD [Ferrimonas sediminicola]
MSDTVHISGLVVSCVAELEGEVIPALAQIPGCELHTKTDDGKLVVTLERESQQSTSDAMDAIAAIEGVLNTALAYHRVEQL